MLTLSLLASLVCFSGGCVDPNAVVGLRESSYMTFETCKNNPKDTCFIVHPTTVISLRTGEKVTVEESIDVVMQKLYKDK